MTSHIPQLLDKIGDLSAKAWTELYEGGEYGTPTQFYDPTEGRKTLLELKPFISDLNNLLSTYE